MGDMMGADGIVKITSAPVVATARLAAGSVTTDKIADANVTTLIVAVILFIIGSGPVQGFAVTLSIGILVSMFTAIIVTRALVNLSFGNRTIEKIRI